MKSRILSLILILSVLPAWAQRAVDQLDRGLVAVKSADGVFCSWRINAHEWYDVKYNIYRDGLKINDAPLTVSNFTDPQGTTASTYTVTAVVAGNESAKCDPANVLEKNYLLVEPKHDPTLTSTYVPNDACCADVDGDGQLEILMKYDNLSEISASYPHDGYNGEYSLFECLKLDGTVLWWVNCGPNMGDFQNNEQNIVGYDWDLDGKAEVVFRAADGTTIHMANGEVYTVGDPSLNYRGATGGGANWFMHSGKEYLLYVNGSTGEPYQCIDYPLPRLEDSENPNGLLSGSAYDALVNTAWGDGYGHRSTKHFFGAPYLDGRRPSIFIARGIYTRHKMVAYDVDPATHQLVERWRWNNAEHGEWFGQGYHNYTVADVDWDGRDEIVFGSMVIDDNGLGLSTCGLGHGDSHHVGDFDPYSHGQEVFACNEDNPNNNFRDATTSKIYYRTTGGNDDGRANMANFIDEYPGAQGVSSRDPNLVGAASHAAIIGDSKSTVSITQNFRIYWDGDLCDESFDYNNGKNSQGAIFKAREGKIAILSGSITNNDTKGTPCYQGDVFGDWREEVIMRDANNNIRIYTTDIPTPWRIYSLWYDHQYRNAMVWQMCGYNQTPHPSFYVGAFEDITVPPAPLTMTDRTEIPNGATISHDTDGKHIIMCETRDMNVNAADGAAPYILTVNAPSWVQGNNGRGITTETFTHTIGSGSFTGSMRLVKQGDGTLVLPKAKHTYTGDTEVWAGKLVCDGTLSDSRVWLNRFGTLATTDGSFAKGIDMHYASVLSIGSETEASTVTTDVLDLDFGAIVEIDLFSEGTAADKVVANVLKIEKKDWTNGPEYLAPILRLVDHTAPGAATLETGRYLIGEIGKIEGSLDNLIIQGMDNLKKVMVYDDGKLYLDVMNFETGTKTWMGTESGIWDIDNTLNFVNAGTDTQSAFFPGDDVIFDDNATVTDVIINENLMPKSLTFNNDTKDYTLSGEGSIVGETSLVKQSGGTVTINNTNQFSGGVSIEGGVLAASSFANTIGTTYGALGGVANGISISNEGTLAATATSTSAQRINIRSGHARIHTPAGVNLTLEKGISQTSTGQKLYKSGTGTLTLAAGNSFNRLIIEDGVVNAAENSSSVIDAAPTVEFIKGSLYDPSTMYTYSTNPTNYIVEEGNSGSLYLDARCNYTGTLTGGGTFSVYAASVRNYLQGNWSNFTGTLNAHLQSRGSSYDPVFYWSNNYGLPNATLNISGGTDFNTEGRSIEVGNLSGTGTLNTSGTVTVGGINKPYSFLGTFSGNPAMVKKGTGDWKVIKVISGLRSITITDGTFSLAANNININVCAIPITIKDSGVLRGRGTITTLTIDDGGELRPGYYTDDSPRHFGPVYITGDATVNNGATLSLFIRKADGTTNARSYLDVKGSLTVNGKIVVEIDADYTPQIGDEIEFWKAQSFAGTPSELILPELPEGMDWDVTELYKASGKLRVIEAAGINDIAADAVATWHVYSTDGTYYGEIDATRAGIAAAIKRRWHLAAGVYIVKASTPTKVVTGKVVIAW